MRPPRQKSKADHPIADAPQDAGRETVPVCPHCRAQDADLISLFGTQAITLQYRCRDCRTYFEAIKY